jgi:hypothetical protein
MDEQLQRAIHAARNGHPVVARNILIGVLKAEPDNETAWLWMASLVEGERREYVLERVLEINPKNELARRELEKMQLMAPAEPETPALEPGAVSFRERRVDPIFTMKGAGELLEVFEDKIAITPKGILGLVSKGLKGTKEIPFTSITAVQFKKAGILSGYLQFTVPGGNEGKEGIWEATSDENTFMFYEDNALATEIKEYIEDAIRAIHSPPTPREPTRTRSLSDELQALAMLREQGVLSEEEFRNAKRKLIG